MDRKKIRIALIILICILCLTMLIIGPILLQQYIGHRQEYIVDGNVLSSEVVGQNIILCWLGAILISFPILALTAICFTLLIRKIISNKKQDGENEK